MADWQFPHFPREDGNLHIDLVKMWEIPSWIGPFKGAYVSYHKDTRRVDM